MKNRFDWKPRPCKRCLNLVIQNVLWSRNVHRRQQRERIEIFILSGLSLSRPVDTNSKCNLNNIITTLSLISISSVKKNSPANVLKLGLNSARWILACAAAKRVTKSPDYTGGFVCLRRRLDECQSWWASTLRAMPPWRHNLCALRLVESQLTSFSTTSLECQESYLTTGMLPYKHSSFFPHFRRAL